MNTTIETDTDEDFASALAMVMERWADVIEHSGEEPSSISVRTRTLSCGHYGVTAHMTIPSCVPLTLSIHCFTKQESYFVIFDVVDSLQRELGLDMPGVGGYAGNA